MNILQLTSTSAIGGAEQMVLALARGLAERGQWQSEIFSLAGPGLLTEAARAAGIEAENFALRRPWQIGELRRLIGRIRGRFDLIQTYGLQADLFGRLFKKNLGAPRLVCGIRSVDEGRSAHKVLLDRWTASRADLFIANSEAGRLSRIRRERIPAEKIITIHNGIALAECRTAVPGCPSREAVRQRLEIVPEHFPVVAHVANLRWMKGHDVALRAAARLARQWPETLFLFAGRDDSQGVYQRQARELGLEKNVRFLGYQPQPREILRAADLAILPSRYEGCPVAILEAMAERRPVVASAVGGIPELVRDGQEALLIALSDDAALAAALDRLARDAELRRQLTEAAYARVAREFTLERMVARYAEAYEEMRNAECGMRKKAKGER